MHHNLYKGTYPYAVLAAAIALAGCNGEGDKNSDSGSPEYMVPASISAQNANFITDYKDEYEVDFSDKVSVEGGKGFTLVEVKPLSNASECQPLEVMAQSFTIAALAVKSCDYEYKVAVTDVANAVAPASLTGAPTDIAITRVAVMSEMPVSSSEVTLPAVSAVAFEEQMLEVDIRDLLLFQAGFMVPFDFTLSEELSLPYDSGFGTAKSDPLRNIITYTPSSGFEGIERILFSYINNNTGEILLGTLDIAVSNANEGLLVKDRNVHAQVQTNQKVTIDVSPYVTPPIDGDDYQLVHVDSFNASTEPFDPDDFSNKRFTFETSQVGIHYVSFAVSDRNGAYGLGLVEIPAFDPNTSSKWGDIEYQGLWFTGPLTTSEAVTESVEYSEARADDFYTPAVSLALLDFKSAKNYCGTKGRLPTSSELIALSSEDVQANHNWPVSVKYLAEDNDVIKVVDLANADSQDHVDGNYLATCVEGGLTVQAPLEDIIANGNSTQLTFNLIAQDEEPSVGETIMFETDSEHASFIDSSAVTDQNGNAIALLSSTKAEDVNVCGSIGLLRSCVSVSFVGDPATAQVTAASMNTSGWTPGNLSSYPVLTQVRDAFDNPVANVVVEYEVVEDTNDQSLSMIPSSITDENGESQTQVVNSESYLSDFSNILVKHQNTSNQVSQTNVEATWGTWQWETPLRVKVLDVITSDEISQDCQVAFGDKWRLPTYEEGTEYKENNPTIATDPIRFAMLGKDISGRIIESENGNRWEFPKATLGIGGGDRLVFGGSVSHLANHEDTAMGVATGESYELGDYVLTTANGLKRYEYTWRNVDWVSDVTGLLNSTSWPEMSNATTLCVYPLNQ